MCFDRWHPTKDCEDIEEIEGCSSTHKLVAIRIVVISCYFHLFPNWWKFECHGTPWSYDMTQVTQPVVRPRCSGDAPAVHRHFFDARGLRRRVVEITGGGGPWRHIEVEECEKIVLMVLENLSISLDYEIGWAKSSGFLKSQEIETFLTFLCLDDSVEFQTGFGGMAQSVCGIRCCLAAHLVWLYIIWNIRRRRSCCTSGSPYVRSRSRSRTTQLVGGLVAIFDFPINIGFIIIPIDELIFFRGLAQPPTRQSIRSTFSDRPKPPQIMGHIIPPLRPGIPKPRVRNWILQAPDATWRDRTRPA